MRWNYLNNEGQLPFRLPMPLYDQSSAPIAPYLPAHQVFHPYSNLLWNLTHIPPTYTAFNLQREDHDPLVGTIAQPPAFTLNNDGLKNCITEEFDRKDDNMLVRDERSRAPIGLSLCDTNVCSTFVNDNGVDPLSPMITQVSPNCMMPVFENTLGVPGPPFNNGRGRTNTDDISSSIFHNIIGNMNDVVEHDASNNENQHNDHHNICSFTLPSDVGFSGLNAALSCSENRSNNIIDNNRFQSHQNFDRVRESEFNLSPPNIKEIVTDKEHTVRSDCIEVDETTNQDDYMHINAHSKDPSNKSQKNENGNDTNCADYESKEFDNDVEDGLSTVMDVKSFPENISLKTTSHEDVISKVKPNDHCSDIIVLLKENGGAIDESETDDAKNKILVDVNMNGAIKVIYYTGQPHPIQSYKNICIETYEKEKSSQQMNESKITKMCTATPTIAGNANDKSSKKRNVGRQSQKQWKKPKPATVTDLESKSVLTKLSKNRFVSKSTDARATRNNQNEKPAQRKYKFRNKKIKCDQCPRDFSSAFTLSNHKVRQHSLHNDLLNSTLKTSLKKATSVTNSKKTDYDTPDNGITEDHLNIAKALRLRALTHNCSSNLEEQYSDKENDSEPIEKASKKTRLKLSKCKLIVNETKKSTLKTINKREFPNPQKCDDCGKILWSYTGLYFHKRKHKDPNLRFKCTECSYVCRSKQIIDRHIRREHSTVKPDPFPCAACKKIFADEYALNQHVRNMHNRPKPLCPVCGQGVWDIKRHLTMHNETKTERKKAFKCLHPDCDLEFLNKGSLKNHTNAVHDRTRKFVCEIDGKVFYTISQFTNHKHIHSDIKPCVCNFCGEAFRRMAHLKIHKLKHTDEKPLKCMLCKFACKQRNSMNWHMKHTHAYAFTALNGKKTVYYPEDEEPPIDDSFRVAIKRSS